MNRLCKSIESKSKYTTNIAYASIITGLTFIANPCYQESKYIIYDYEWKSYECIKLKHKEKGIPLFASYPELFPDEITYVSVTCFRNEPNSLYRVDSKNIMLLDWYAQEIFKKSLIPNILRFIMYYHQSTTDKCKKQRKIIKTKHKSKKKLKKKMINPQILTLQFASYMGVNMYSYLRKGNTKVPHMTHIRTPKMWYKRDGEATLSSLCDKPKSREGVYDKFGPMDKDQLSKWINKIYLKHDIETGSETGTYIPTKIVLKYNRNTHWLQSHFTIKRTDILGQPHGIYLEV
eukprot:144320_1